MKVLILVGVLSFIAAYTSGCSSTNPPAPTISPTALTQLSAQCTNNGAALASASASTNAQLSQTATYMNSFCQQLNSGVVPATANANTSQWMTTGLTTLEVAAQVAGVVLPLLL